MINKQFLYYTDYNKFLLDVENGKVNHNSIAFIVHGDRHIIWTQGNVFTDEDKFEQNGVIGNWFKEHNKTVYDVFSMLENRVKDLESNDTFTYNQ